MSFKEQLEKHANILNKYKSLYIDNNQSINNNIINVEKNDEIYRNENSKEIDQIDDKFNEQMNIKNNNDINLEKIDHLISKLNFKRENNYQSFNSEEKKIDEHNNSNKSSNDISKLKKSSFDINAIKAKYLNNNDHNLNLAKKFLNEQNEEIKDNNNDNNNKLNTINNIKKLNLLNARNEIERIKGKYYTMSLNNKNYINNYINNNNIITKENNAFNTPYYIQLNKEIIELKAKLNLYEEEISKSNKSIISNNIIQSFNNIRDTEITQENKKKKKSNLEDNNSKDNNNKETFISFKYNNINDTESNQNDNNLEENIINEPKEKEKENEKKEKTKINDYYSDINFISQNADYDYSEVLPIIDKVSKLKELNDIEEDFEYQKSNDDNTQNNNVTEMNKSEELPNDNIEFKEKDIGKIDNFENRNKKIKLITFEEFLAKDEKNNNE